jgi:hypothetical protein
MQEVYARLDEGVPKFAADKEFIRRIAAWNWITDVISIASYNHTEKPGGVLGRIPGKASHAPHRAGGAGFNHARGCAFW